MVKEVQISHKGAAAELAQVQLAPLLLAHKELAPFMKDFLLFDERTFIHSMCVASVAMNTYESLSKSIPDLPFLDNENRTVLHYGALLHDLGKAGVEEDSSSSSRSLYPEENLTSHSSLFTPDYHAPKIADKHEMIGAQMTHLLFSELSMHKKVKERTVTLIKNHHKKPNDYIGLNPDKTYETLPKMGSTQTFLHILLVASDIATAMSESRGYHTNGKPCTQYQIYIELQNEITTHLIQSLFDKKTLNEAHIAHLKDVIIKAAMKSAFEISHITETNEHNLNELFIDGEGEESLTPLITQARQALGMPTTPKM